MQRVKITLPKLGESVAEATLTTWLKEPGDRIERDETLCEVGTDKVESELPSEYSGVVEELLFEEGDLVKVGQAIAIISTEDAPTIAVDEFVEQAISEDELAAHPSRNKGELDKDSQVGFLTPVVRRMIAEHGIEIDQLEQIKATGANGRVTKKDVQAYLDKKNKPKQVATSHKLDLTVAPGDEVIALGRMRMLLSEHLQRASQLIPHVTTFVEVDVSNMVAKRKAEKEHFATEHGTKLTFTHFLQYAVIQALQTYPQLNSWFNEDEWILKQDINLGFAAALPNGNLIVPNVKAAQQYEFVDFVKAMNEKAAQAKSSKLKPDDLEQTTFTVSNTGMFGSQMGTPIVSIPQVAVLALGAILRKPVVKVIDGEERIVPADVMTCSISYDHRVIDGALASQFLMEVKKNVERIN